MNKKALILAMADHSGISTKQARAALDALLAGIETQLMRGEAVYLPPLGTFRVQRRPSRMLRTATSPVSGARSRLIRLPERNSPKFVPSDTLKAVVNL